MKVLTDIRAVKRWEGKVYFGEDGGLVGNKTIRGEVACRNINQSLWR
jgi:hypothetical protein